MATIGIVLLLRSHWIQSTMLPHITFICKMLLAHLNGHPCRARFTQTQRPCSLDQMLSNTACAASSITWLPSGYLTEIATRQKSLHTGKSDLPRDLTSTDHSTSFCKKEDDPLAYCCYPACALLFTVGFFLVIFLVEHQLIEQVSYLDYVAYQEMVMLIELLPAPILALK